MASDTDLSQPFRAEGARPASALAPVAAQAILGALARNRMLVALIAVHFVLTIAAGALSGVPYDPGTFAALSQLFTGLLPSFLAGVVIWRFVHMVRHERPERPLAWMATDIRRILSDRQRVVDGLVTLAALAVFTGSFGYFKEIIPNLLPFSWDPVFAHLDRVLHGGTLPYVYLMPIFGSPYAVTAINLVYQGWFFVMFFMIFLATFSTADRASRATFLVGFVLTWGLGGNVVATLLSSAGPVYYGRLGFGHDFDALNATLAAYAQISPNWSLNVQQWLWNGYLGHGQIRGISAMPSMHVASSTVLMLYGYRRGRLAGRVLTLFWATICLGAVLLAWHYAVDVYAGAAFGLLSWWLAAALTGNRAFRRAQPAKYRSAGT
jgi:membrane-associated phospholipid phosphatase